MRSSKKPKNTQRINYKVYYLVCPKKAIPITLKKYYAPTRSSEKEKRKKKKKRQRIEKCTVLPQRSRASMLAFRLSRSLTTSIWPSQAAICRAVRPSKSMLFTSVPSFNKSSTPFTSPLHAINSICMVESRFSGTDSSSFTGLRRIGSSDDCLPRLNLRLVLRGSSDDCRENCRLRVLSSDPVENWREMPRFSWAAISISTIQRLANT